MTKTENQIITWSGVAMDPLDAKVSDIRISDIAHALARTCRYSGHVGGYLSVARHSIWVSERVWSQTGDTTLTIQGLLHDAAEAYLTDVPRPVKHNPAMQVLHLADLDLTTVVMEAMGLPTVIQWHVTEADDHVLRQVEMPHPAGARYTWTSTPVEDERDFMNRYSSLRRQASALV